MIKLQTLYNNHSLNAPNINVPIPHPLTDKPSATA